MISLAYFLKYFDTARLLHGTNTANSFIAHAYNNIGSTYKEVCNYTTALDFCHKALDMLKLLYCEESRDDIAISYNNIGVLYRSLCDYAKALDYFIKALDIYIVLYGKRPHTSKANCHNNIGSVYNEL